MISQILRIYTYNLKAITPMKTKSLILTIVILSVYLTASAQVLVNPGGGAHLGRYTTTYGGGAQPFTYDWELPGGTDLIDKTQRNPKVVAGFTKPVQTNSWWTSAIWNYYQSDYNGEFTGNMIAHPWTVRAISGGLQMQYKNNASVFCPSSTDFLANSATNQISVSLSKGAGTPQLGTATNMNVPAGVGQGIKVKDYGDYHVTVNWDDAANTMGMDATVTKGSPFLFFDNITTGTDVVIRTGCGPMTLAFTSPSGNRRVTICGQDYGIYFSPGTTIVNNPVGGTMWRLNEGHAAGDNVDREFLRVTPPAAAGQRYIILAALPNATNATFLEYERRAYAFVTGTSAGYTYNEATANVTTNYVTTTALKANAPAGITPLNEPIHAVYRHQFLNIDPTTVINTAYQYESPRGNMQVRYGNFNTIMKHYGMLQRLPWYGSYKGADSIALYNMINTKYNQGAGNLIAPTTDLYFFGKRLAEIAQLIPIAKAVGHVNAYNRFRTDLRAYLADLLTVNAGETNHIFYYNDQWDMLVHHPASFWSADQSNDRHFHYGYVIEAAAMMARYDATFVTEYGAMVEMLIKDVANWQHQAGGAGNGIFPYLRFFDTYEGHSWANGMSTDGENYGNDQESTSEAINCWSSIALWGKETGNNTIRDMGIYLRTTEIAAVEQYWFDVNNAVFPACYAPTSIGILRGNGGNFATFWTNNRQCIYSINWLPFTGSSFYLGLSQPAGATQANKVADMLANQVAPATPGAIYYDSDHFPDLVISYMSLYDPVNAKNLYNNLPANMNPVDPACCPFNNLGQNHTYRYFDGQYTAYTHHWTRTLDSLRNVQRIWSNYSKTHVFFNGCWYYVIDNDGSSPINVTFSDGRVINNAPADSVSVYRFCTIPMPVELLSFEAKLKGKTAALSWTTVYEENSSYFEVEKSCDGIHFETIETVKAKGNSSSLVEYSAIDEQLCASVSYYRLKEVDFDGSFHYSTIVQLTENGRSVISIQPIPTNSNLTIRLNNSSEKKYRFSFIDLMGREVMNLEKNIGTGLQTIELDLSGLASGTYVLSVSDQESGQEFYKIVKE
jgi:endoglucanase Acf2